MSYNIFLNGAIFFQPVVEETDNRWHCCNTIGITIYFDKVTGKICQHSRHSTSCF